VSTSPLWSLLYAGSGWPRGKECTQTGKKASPARRVAAPDEREVPSARGTHVGQSIFRSISFLAEKAWGQRRTWSHSVRSAGNQPIDLAPTTTGSTTDQPSFPLAEIDVSMLAWRYTGCGLVLSCMRHQQEHGLSLTGAAELPLTRWWHSILPTLLHIQRGFDARMLVLRCIPRRNPSPPDREVFLVGYSVLCGEFSDDIYDTPATIGPSQRERSEPLKRRGVSCVDTVPPQSL